MSLNAAFRLVFRREDLSTAERDFQDLISKAHGVSGYDTHICFLVLEII